MSSAPQNHLLTLPNLLSLARLPLGGLFWVALARGPAHAELPFAVLAAAAVTDVLDGWIARRRGADPAGVGSWLDPICDKVFVASVLAALYLQRHVPLSLLALVVARELLQVPMALVYRASATLRRWLHYDFRASLLGKGATVAQFLAVSAIILDAAAARGLAVLAFALGMLALADYIRRAIVIGKRHPPTQERHS
ncbi:MAG TPA: CDP-alcohol phosphatidyltransferase family protein [Polyangia bacterium]|nr:CDP-alcohol phosphatidyltransferase family protein [Polyangia bacterium]